LGKESHVFGLSDHIKESLLLGTLLLMHGSFALIALEHVLPLPVDENFVRVLEHFPE
jgi:hypothetical protein